MGSDFPVFFGFRVFLFSRFPACFPVLPFSRFAVCCFAVLAFWRFSVSSFSRLAFLPFASFPVLRECPHSVRLPPSLLSQMEVYKRLGSVLGALLGDNTLEIYGRGGLESEVGEGGGSRTLHTAHSAQFHRYFCCHSERRIFHSRAFVVLTFVALQFGALRGRVGVCHNVCIPRPNQWSLLHRGGDIRSLLHRRVHVRCR